VAVEQAFGVAVGIADGDGHGVMPGVGCVVIWWITLALIPGKGAGDRWNPFYPAHDRKSLAYFGRPANESWDSNQQGTSTWECQKNAVLRHPREHPRPKRLSEYPLS
jgi:hypothetical protein